MKGARRLFRNATGMSGLGRWMPEAIVIPTGCETCDGISDVDPDHPAAA